MVMFDVFDVCVSSPRSAGMFSLSCNAILAVVIVILVFPECLRRSLSSHPSVDGELACQY